MISLINVMLLKMFATFCNYPITGMLIKCFFQDKMKIKKFSPKQFTHTLYNTYAVTIIADWQFNAQFFIVIFFCLFVSCVLSSCKLEKLYDKLNVVGQL